MEIKQIESFVRVAEMGSFSRASAALDIPQPSLSRHVRQLEQETRSHLFVRTGRGVELTEAGQCLLSHGQAILELTRKAQTELDALQGKFTGRVTVGLPPRVAMVLAPLLVKSFRSRWPKASISISEGLSVSLREDLILGRIEMAVLFDPSPSPKIEWQSLFQEDLVLCGRPTRAHPLPARIAAAELSRYPVMLPAMPNAIRSLIETHCGARGIVLNVVAELDSVQSLLKLAVDGQGYAIVPRGSASKLGPGVKVSSIENPDIRNNLVLAFSRQRLLSRLGQATFDLIVAHDVGALLTG
ncbi:LysR family transcriptional regulator [Hydrogenophaga sp.]|uniref:LysR family transcriptional regulator n=1 Tax=Hydrogenophaga sp. TaxID=1904254 RepID=UPI0027212F6C|nr:LysR family transcriptional regulator [Hydrogenophaga sp.]MDO9436417.1 LysR family transcriptional regulator [Hydrogenophaga sp.]